jgi:hypothetical protein
MQIEQSSTSYTLSHSSLLTPLLMASLSSLPPHQGEGSFRKKKKRGDLKI